MSTSTGSNFYIEDITDQESLMYTTSRILGGLLPISAGTGPTGSTGNSLGPTGSTGAQRLFAFKGTWNISTTYTIGDVVYYGNGTYISITGNNIATPPVIGSNSAAYNYIPSVTGPTGAAANVVLTGPQSSGSSPTGNVGITGLQGSSITGLTGISSANITGPTGAQSTVLGPTGPQSTSQGPTGNTGASSTITGPTGGTGPTGSTTGLIQKLTLTLPTGSINVNFRGAKNAVMHTYNISGFTGYIGMTFSIDNVNFTGSYLSTAHTVAASTSGTFANNYGFSSSNTSNILVTDNSNMGSSTTYLYNLNSSATGAVTAFSDSTYNGFEQVCSGSCSGLIGVNYMRINTATFPTGSTFMIYRIS